LILLDLMMPKKNGFEVIQELRLDASFDNIPIIILSNLSQDTDRQKCIDLGVAKYLVKSDTPIRSVVEHIKQELVQSRMK